MGRPSKWSPEFKEEAVRLQRESGESITAVAKRLGLSPETLRNWVRRDEVERGEARQLVLEDALDHLVTHGDLLAPLSA